MKEWFCFDPLNEVFGIEQSGEGAWIEHEKSESPGTHPYGPLISEALKGRKITWGDKISKARTGVPTGRKMSEEQKRKMSEARWKGHTKKTKEEHRIEMRERMRQKYKKLKQNK